MANPGADMGMQDTGASPGTPDQGATGSDPVREALQATVDAATTALQAYDGEEYAEPQTDETPPVTPEMGAGAPPTGNADLRKFLGK